MCSWSSLNFFKGIILNSSFEFIDHQFSEISFWNFFKFSLVVFYLIFHDAWFLILFVVVVVHLSKQSPLPNFTGLFSQRQFSASSLSLGFWICPLLMSLGRRGILSGFVWGQGHHPSPEVGGEGVPLAENSWIGLITWFPTQVKLQGGFSSCLGSLVRLPR